MHIITLAIINIYFFNENLYITRLECAAITHVSRINVSSEMQVLVVL